MLRPSTKQRQRAQSSAIAAQSSLEGAACWRRLLLLCASVGFWPLLCAPAGFWPLLRTTMISRVVRARGLALVSEVVSEVVSKLGHLEATGGPVS